MKMDWLFPPSNDPTPSNDPDWSLQWSDPASNPIQDIKDAVEKLGNPPTKWVACTSCATQHRVPVSQDVLRCTCGVLIMNAGYPTIYGAMN